MLGQLHNVSGDAIKDWLLVLGGILGLVLLLKQLFVRKPPIEAEFVTKLQHDADLNAIRRDVESLRGKVDHDTERVIAKLEETKTDLFLDGRRRSQTLFDHIKDLSTEIFSRLNTQQSEIARLDERTKA